MREQLAIVAALACSCLRGQPTPPVRWLKLGAELRGRFEQKYGLKYTAGDDDTYYLQRLRLNAELEPASWLRLFVQGQDARAPWFSRPPTPSSFRNPLDLRQGYLELGRLEDEGAHWGVRAGRQEIRLGDARLIGPSNWSNSARSWDAVRAAFRTARFRVDALAAALVPIATDRFDHPSLRNAVYGLYASSTRVIPRSVLEPYVFWKTNSSVRGELGRPGDLDLFTWGVRAADDSKGRFGYGVETAVQTGRYAGDPIRAWAGHWHVSYLWRARAWEPLVLVEYNYASGDANPRDGRRGTFDQLYPSNHDKYGTADRVTWRNLHNLRTGVEVKPRKAWSFHADYHNFWLASRQEGMYTDGGRLIAINRSATSSYIGPEIDLHATRQVSERLSLAFGYSHLFAGGFLRQTVKERGSTYPYIMWLYRY